MIRSVMKHASTIFNRPNVVLNPLNSNVVPNPLNWELQQWRGVRVKVRNNNLEQALFIMQRKMQSSGIERLIKREQLHHIKNSEKRVLARKILERKIRSQELARSFRSSGMSDDTQSVSSQEHGWTYDTYQTNFAVEPFHHPDPYYHGLVAAYGNQTMVQSQMLGMASPRVPLPLELKQDEPIFVNAKQYQAILRRRQYRVRLEAQNKLSKGRKPYLHESRHRHALTRPRGPGGRFVNMKKTRESKSTDLINGQDSQVPNELQLSTKMLERDAHQSGSYSTPAYSSITSGSNSDAIYHHQPFKYSAFSACTGGTSQQDKEKKDNISNPCLSSF